MAITDAQYIDWLKTDGQHRQVLVVATHSTGVEYFSTSPFVSKPTDSIADTPFNDVLTDIPRITRSIDGRTSFGKLVLVNTGELDNWLDFAWYGYDIKIYFGDISWNFDDFRLVLAGVNGGISRSSNNFLEFQIYDKRKFLDVDLPMQDTAYNEKVPVALGQLFNVSPVLKDHTTLTYYCADAAATISDVRDNGVSVTYTDNTDGSFTKSTAVAGELSADVQQASDTPSAMVLDICNRISFTDVDTAQINSFANVSKIGLYVTAPTKVSRLLTDICLSFGAFWSFSRTGLLQIHQFTDDLTTAKHILYDDDIIDAGIELTKIDEPVEKTELNYKRNWRVQSDTALAGSVSDDLVVLYKNQYSTVSTLNTLTGYPIKTEQAPINTLIFNQADAQAECDRRAAIRASKHKIFKVKAFSAPFVFEIGDVVEVTYSRFNLNAVNMKILSMTEYPSDNKVELELWI